MVIQVGLPIIITEKNTISICYCQYIMENQSTRANYTKIWDIMAVYNDKVKQNVKVDI